MAKSRQQWLDEIADREKRWLVFLDRLEQRVKEFVEGALPELRETYNNDTDTLKRGYQRLADSVEGQIESVRKKANKVHDVEIDDHFSYLVDFFASTDDESLDGLLDTSSDIEFEVCNPRYLKFERTMDYWSKQIVNIKKEDLQNKYQAILDEYEQIKDKFVCKQCGSPISIPHIFLTTTYIECPSCQTQNTFEPSTRSKELDFVGHELAEYKNEALLDAYEAEKELHEFLYDRISNLESDIDGLDEEDDAKRIAILKTKRQTLKADYEAQKEKIRDMYKKYLKAVFEEWKKLVPQLAEQNQKVYEGWLVSYERNAE